MFSFRIREVEGQDSILPCHRRICNLWRGRERKRMEGKSAIPASGSALLLEGLVIASREGKHRTEDLFRLVKQEFIPIIGDNDVLCFLKIFTRRKPE